MGRLSCSISLRPIQSVSSDILASRRGPVKPDSYHFVMVGARNSYHATRRPRYGMCDAASEVSPSLVHKIYYRFGGSERPRPSPEQAAIVIQPPPRPALSVSMSRCMKHRIGAGLAPFWTISPRRPQVKRKLGDILFGGRGGRLRKRLGRRGPRISYEFFGRSDVVLGGGGRSCISGRGRRRARADSRDGWVGIRPHQGG